MDAPAVEPSASADDPLLVEVADGVAWLTFNNPSRHNALTLAMAAAIVDAISTVERDDGVRAIVLRGAGERAFMSGADIDEQGREPERYREAAIEALAAIAGARKPIVAAIRGFCLGGGMSIALLADIRIATSSSTFGIPAARLGIGYPWDSIGPLLALVGPGATADILFTARRLDGTEAAAIGLVQRLVDDGELDACTLECASQIAANAPLTIQAAKTALRFARPALVDDDLVALRRLILACEVSEDYQEGQAAFHERRPPRFRGR